MSLPLKIALRYFFSRKSSGAFNAITIISYVSLLGYAVGAAALIIVLSVFNGFESLFISMYSSFDPNIKISAAYGKGFDSRKARIFDLQKLNNINTLSFVLEENVLINYDGRQTLATAKGVDAEYLKVVNLDSNLIIGDLLIQSGDTNFALCGLGLSYQLGIDPNDQFNYLSIFAPQKGKVDLLNPEASFSKDVIFPVGVFSVQEEIDNKFVLVPLRFLQKLLQKDGFISGIELSVKNVQELDETKSEIQKILGPDFIIKNRYEQRDSFFKVMKSEKTISYLILLFILMVAAFNAIGSLYMLVIEKKKDLRILSSLGFSGANAAKVFRYEGLLIAVIGGIIGMLLGLLICWLQIEYGFVKLQSSSSFIISSYPVEMKLQDFAVVFITILGLGFITTLYPSYRASKSV